MKKNYNELWIKVFEEDRYTRKEAERAIDNGSMVLESEFDLQGFLDDWNKSAAPDDDILTVEKVKSGTVEDIYPVKHDGKEYYIVLVH